MSKDTIERLKTIDDIIVNSIKTDDMCEFEKNLNDFNNVQVFVGCTGCGGTQMCGGGDRPSLSIR